LKGGRLRGRIILPVGGGSLEGGEEAAEAAQDDAAPDPEAAQTRVIFNTSDFNYLNLT